MIDKKQLEVALKTASKKGRWLFGYKEVTGSFRGTKLTVYSSSLDEGKQTDVLALCRASKIPVIQYEGSSLELGKSCGKPFRVSIASIKSIEDADAVVLLELAERSG